MKTRMSRAIGSGEAGSGTSRRRAIDIQLFADERPFPATPRKRQEARKRGQVFRSGDATSAAVVVGTLVCLRWLLPEAGRAWQSLFRALWGQQLPEMTWDNLPLVWEPAMRVLLSSSLPVMLAALAIGIVMEVGQVGFLFTTAPLAPDLGRLDPFKGLARMFSRRSLVELAKASLKVGIVGYVCYLTISPYVPTLTSLAVSPLGESLRVAGEVCSRLLQRAALGFLLLGGADWFYQRWEYDLSLRMSRQEMKEEFRQMEGSPELRARIRRRQREISRLRMVSAVPEADVVIRNPTTYAVALKYDARQMDAPVVVAKGKGYLAQRIIELACKHWVTVVENRSLARSLFTSVEVGQAIPPELYQAVAEVLAFVYRLTGRPVEEA